jgi:hypothetical protein
MKALDSGSLIIGTAPISGIPVHYSSFERAVLGIGTNISYTASSRPAVKDAGHAALVCHIRSEEMYDQVLSAFQATPRKTIIAENSIHTIKPIAAASPP